MARRNTAADITPAGDIAFNPWFITPAPWAMHEAPVALPSTSRGSLSRLVEGLILDTLMSYKNIVAAAQKEFPTCLTSTKSVASVAAALKRAGKPVPSRLPQRAI